MKTTFKILVVIVGLFLTANGIFFMFFPEPAMAHMSVSALNGFGLGSVRGIAGGAALVAGLAAMLSIILKKEHLLHTPALILIGWTIGRMVGLIADGFDPGTLKGIVLSFFIAIIIIVGSKVVYKKGNA